MAVIITDMQMPIQCWQCVFHFRTDNAHIACSRHPMEPPVEDGDERPKHCPLKEQNAVKAQKKNDDEPIPCTSWWYVCGDCGQEIDYHDRFCRWCGKAVKWDD